MSLGHSPSIVTNGIVLYYDQANIKSYKGPVIQNMVSLSVANTGVSAGYSSVAGTEIVNIPGIGSTQVTYNLIQNNYPTTSTNCCPSLFSFNGNMAATPSTLYTYAIVYKCESGYTHPNYMYRYEYTSNGGTLVIEAGVHNTTNRIHLGNGWYWAWGSFTTGATTNWFGYMGAFYYRWTTSTDKLTVAKVLLTPGNYTALHPKYWPDVLSTRSNTQSILDLTSRNVITTASLTYANDGAFSFNGTSGKLTTPTLPYQFLTTGFTVSIIFKYTQTTTNDNVISWGSSAFNTTSYAWELRLRGGGAVEFSPGIGPGGSGVPTRTSYGQSPALSGRNVVIDVTYVANGVASIYENGVLKATNNYSGVGSSTATNSLTIGQGSDTYFPGSIYSTKVYNRALSEAEVRQNFNAIRGRYGL